MKRLAIVISLVIGVAACEKEPLITDTMLDGDIVFDPSLYSPADYLVSHAKPNPTPAEADIPVIIASHGYSATTFEWDELRVWTAGRNDVLISQVLLGGHGRTYSEFRDSSWKDWQSAITEEYERLVKAGYKNINLLGSSTSCALIIDLLASGYFENQTVPFNILLVDPIVISSAKSLTLIGIVGPMLGYIEAENTLEEDKYWYHFRPQETLQELQTVITRVRKELQKGIVLPPNCSLKVYKSTRDAVADPASAVLIYKGMTNSDGSPVDVEMIDSDLHVFTRLGLRDNPSTKDIQNQEAAFNDIIARVLR